MSAGNAPGHRVVADKARGAVEEGDVGDIGGAKGQGEEQEGKGVRSDADDEVSLGELEKEILNGELVLDAEVFADAAKLGNRNNDEGGTTKTKKRSPIGIADLLSAMSHRQSDAALRPHRERAALLLAEERVMEQQFPCFEWN